jgi:hypothetical protein
MKYRKASAKNRTATVKFVAEARVCVWTEHVWPRDRCQVTRQLDWIFCRIYFQENGVVSWSKQRTLPSICSLIITISLPIQHWINFTVDANYGVQGLWIVTQLAEKFPAVMETSAQLSRHYTLFWASLIHFPHLHPMYVIHYNIILPFTFKFSTYFP